MKKTLEGVDARHSFLVFQGIFVCILQALAASTLPALEYLWVRTHRAPAGALTRLQRSGSSKQGAARAGVQRQG